MTISENNNFKEKLSFIIPTKDRPERLNCLLSSIKKQRIQPNQIVIIDASSNPYCYKKLLEDYKDLAIDYKMTKPPSLTRQRNIGLQTIKPDTTLVGFLDDDVELEDNSISEMLGFWANANDNLGGAIFNVITDRSSRFFLPKKIFCMGNESVGKMLRSGFNTKICPATTDTYTQWLLGGVTIWRKKIVDEFKFDEWFEGYGLFEDLEYSYRVGKLYDLAVVSKAKVKHYYLGINRSDNYQFGKMEIVNRYHIVKNNPELSTMQFYWASSGQFLENLLRTILERKRGYLLRAFGNLKGALETIKLNFSN